MQLEISKIKSSFLGPYDLVLDIESTGFSRENDLVFLIGLQDGDKLRQWIIEDPGQEKNMLKEALFHMAGKNIHTFNGDLFDLPFIKARAEKHGLIPVPFKSIDYYTFFRKRKKFYDFPDLKLQTFERFAGIRRNDTMSGREVAKAFCELNDQELRKKVLLHNYEDVSNLCLMVPFFRALKEKLKTDHPFSLLLEQLYFKGDYCYIEYLPLLQDSFNKENPDPKIRRQALNRPNMAGVEKMDYISDYGRIISDEAGLSLIIPFHTIPAEALESSRSSAEHGDLKVAVSPFKRKDPSEKYLPSPFLSLEKNGKINTANIHLLLRDLYNYLVK